MNNSMQENLEHLPDEVITGLEAFRNEAFYAAHEYFEDAWRKTPDPSREFYRALLHISGGFYRLTQDRPVAAKKFFTHAIKWLAFFPYRFADIQTDLLIFNLEQVIQAFESSRSSEKILKEYLKPIQTILEMRTP
jgi:predicted metal-dependent hydrolase